MKVMEPIVNKIGVFLMDFCSGSMLLFGIFSGQDLALLLGALGSITAIVNHGSQWWSKTGRDWWHEIRNKKNKKQ